jgi:hypothetical protein
MDLSAIFSPFYGLECNDYGLECNDYGLECKSKQSKQLLKY